MWDTLKCGLRLGAYGLNVCVAMERECDGDYIMNCVCRYSVRDVWEALQGVFGQV